MAIVLDLDQFNQNNLNAANAYINNFADNYMNDDSVPATVMNRNNVELPNEYNRTSYDFAVAYRNRYQNQVVGGRRRRQSRRSRRQQRQRRSRRSIRSRRA